MFATRIVANPPVSLRKTVVVRSSETPSTPAPEPVEAYGPNQCSKCGIDLKEAPSGCKDGRIAGGVGAVVDWWPIKAYRPCPNLSKAGKEYARKGQITDEVLFGRNTEIKF